jgi:hypothetical protein
MDNKQMMSFCIAFAALYFSNEYHLMSRVWSPACDMLGFSMSRSPWVVLFLLHCINRFMGRNDDHSAFTVTVLIAAASGVSGFAVEVVWWYFTNHFLGLFDDLKVPGQMQDVMDDMGDVGGFLILLNAAKPGTGFPFM